MEGTEGELPPPGTRWGSGAQSVLPYLTKTLQAKPVEPRPSARGNPVFADWPRRERPRP
ncbi:MAG TPA: hypothetical protein VIL30_06870 [Ramlibacter sp.]